MPLFLLDADNPQQAFPPLSTALKDPNGLLAMGGCLSPQRIINAYQQGIFPCYNPDEPILWWSPDPRLVVFPEHLQVSRSLTKTLRKQAFEIVYDRAFSQVMRECAAPRDNHAGTWISEQMIAAYKALHQLGVAHSFEAWQGDELVGGLYGLGIGQVFFGESMFHRKTDASKVVFVHLVRQLSAWGYRLIDCQVSSAHLLSLGAEEISRNSFKQLLDQLCQQPVSNQAWQ